MAREYKALFNSQGNGQDDDDNKEAGNSNQYQVFFFFVLFCTLQWRKKERKALKNAFEETKQTASEKEEGVDICNRVCFCLLLPPLFVAAVVMAKSPIR